MDVIIYPCPNLRESRKGAHPEDDVTTKTRR